MTEFDPTQPMVSALVLGIIYGATFCTLTCSPFIASYIVGTERGTKRGVWLSVIFNSGRILTYGLLGVVVGIVGGAFLEEAAFAQWGALTFGALVVVLGIWIAVRRASRRCDCRPAGSWTQRLLRRLKLGEEGSKEAYAGLMGVLIGLVPCPPLIALLVFAATYGSAAAGLVLGLLFGVGTLVSPIIIIAAAAGWFSDRIAKDAPVVTRGVQRVAGVLLVILGLWTAYRAALPGFGL